jgi:hypothetical protein
MRLIGLAVFLVVGLILAPLAAEAQQAAKIARIGYLVIDRAASPHLREAFLQELRDEGKPERLTVTSCSATVPTRYQ